MEVPEKVSSPKEKQKRLAIAVGANRMIYSAVSFSVGKKLSQYKESD